MGSEDHADGQASPQTARTVGQLVKYSREVNQSQTVHEVGTYALEATFHVMDGHPTPTVTEVHQGDLRVLESMAGHLESGGEPDAVARYVYDNDATVVVPAPDTEVAYTSAETTVLDRADLEGAVESGVTVGVPSFRTDEFGEIGVILSVHWPSLSAVEQYHLKPLEYLADHVATAVKNVRSRERLERARNDLETRKEMIQMYDRLLRHDLGNDLQVIAGFSDAVVSTLDGEGQTADYAEKIQRTAESAADLVDRVGDLVKTLEQEEEPTVRPLAPILTQVVDDVEAKYTSLSVEYDPAAVDYQVYAGDLLDSVFQNVLSNAAQHNEGGVTVRVYAEEPAPDALVVGFADDGAGIREAVADDIFEMGVKGPDSEGTGFGLGFARALTESYGGTVTVEDSEDGGADFRVTLTRP